MCFVLISLVTLLSTAPTSNFGMSVVREKNQEKCVPLLQKEGVTSAVLRSIDDALKKK